MFHGWNIGCIYGLLTLHIYLYFIFSYFWQNACLKSKMVILLTNVFLIEPYRNAEDPKAHGGLTFVFSFKKLM